MKLSDSEQLLMRIFVSESDKFEGKSLYEVLVNTLRDEKVAGATVLRGIEGFGANRHLHKSSILGLSQGLPIVIEVIDTGEKIDEILPKIDNMIGEGLITIEKVRALRYGNADENSK